MVEDSQFRVSGLGLRVETFGRNAGGRTGPCSSSRSCLSTAPRARGPRSHAPRPTRPSDTYVASGSVAIARRTTRRTCSRVPHQESTGYGHSHRNPQVMVTPTGREPPLCVGTLGRWDCRPVEERVRRRIARRPTAPPYRHSPRSERTYIRVWGRRCSGKTF